MKSGLIFSLLSFTFSLSAFAVQADKGAKNKNSSASPKNKELILSLSNVDLLGHFGYSNMTESDDRNVSYGGFNLGASALYSTTRLNLGSPVVGVGINYTRDSKSDSGSKYTISSFATELEAGFKFTVVPKFTIIPLVDLGIGLLNSYELSKNNVTISPDVSNHTYCGLSLSELYEVSPKINVGLNVGYNSHSETIEATTGTRSYSHNYNEFTFNLIASYNL